MPTRAILGPVVRVLCSPFVLGSYAVEALGICNLREDVEICLGAIDGKAMLPEPFIRTLIVAEDHRSSIHPGVDPIAVIRVVVLWMRTGRQQGASTIEQQLVRVVLDRYEKTCKRKLLEQLTAIAISRRRSKARIASAYLSSAFYGSAQYGIAALKRRCGDDLRFAPQSRIVEMVAKLKYPEPLVPSANWVRVHRRRVQYIERRLRQLNQS